MSTELEQKTEPTAPDTQEGGIPQHPSDLPVTILQPSKGWVSLGLRELWDYRELLYFLTWRDIKVRYKQTALGVAWAVLQPLLTMIVFSVIFGQLAKLPSDGIPYPVFALCALVPWQLFSYALTQSGNSLVSSQQLITKVYFPRLIIPISAVLGGLVDFAIAFVLLLILMLYFGIVPTLAIVTLPLFTLLAIVSALAVGLWLSALNVRYRDVRYTIPFLTQFWMYATPIAYASSLIPEQWRGFYNLNPLAGVVEGFRWALLGTAEGPGLPLVVSAVVIVALLVSGLMYFRRVEQTFADIV